MKNLLTKLAISSAFLLSTSVFAQKSPFSYNYVEAGYGFGTIEVLGASFDTTGFGVSGSASLNDSIFLGGSFTDGQAKLNGVTINQDTWTLGVGARLPAGQSTDFVSTISYINSRLSALGAAETVTGYGVDIGLRHLVGEKVELSAGVGMSILGDDNERTTDFSAGLRFRVSKEASVGISYTAANADGGDSRTTLISARLEF